MTKEQTTASDDAPVESKKTNQIMLVGLDFLVAGEKGLERLSLTAEEFAQRAARYCGKTPSIATRCARYPSPEPPYCSSTVIPSRPNLEAL